MVAITVILAAVIGTFVLGLGDNVQSTPTAQFSIDYQDATTTSGSVTATHDGGDSIEASALSVNIAGDSYDWTNAVNGDSSVTSGMSLEIGGTTNANVDYTDKPSSGDEVRVIWTAESGGSSQTLVSSEVP